MGTATVEYYCLMVRAGKEGECKEQIQRVLDQHEASARLFFFQRKLKKGNGSFFDVPLFTGCVFLQTERLTPEMLKLIRQTGTFFHFLPRNTTPLSIRGPALQELQHYVDYGEYLDASQLLFLPERRIKALSGPLVGLEGSIYKVNKKKKQITLFSKLRPDGDRFDLIYEDVPLAEAPAPERER